MKVSYVDVCFHGDDLHPSQALNGGYVDWLPSYCELLDLADHRLGTPSRTQTVNIN